MSQAIPRNTTLPARSVRPRKNPATAAPAAKAPQTVRMQFPGSDQEYVCAFVDGPSDIGMIAILNHDAGELDRIVAGLAAFRAQARGQQPAAAAR